MTSDTSPMLEWSDDGAPRSGRFGDIYFSREDGLAETRAVFLDGCGLPEAWAGRRRFVVAELGFGSGLNIAALLKLWRETAAPDARLNIFTVEGFPLSREEAARALAAWPELAAETEALLAAWPTAARGFQRLDLPAWRAVIDVAVLDVETALSQWSGAADAWFLDGFSPALNPGMWSEAVMALVGARSAPGARAATFTVAGAVRRGLEAGGFAVEKRPGHGRKRERLEARRPGDRPERPPRHVAVIGGGVAGAAMVRALAAQGLAATLIDDGGLAASGNPAALVTPGLDASGRAPARFYAQTCARAAQLYRADGLVLSEGVERRPRDARDLKRFEKVAAQDIFAPGEVVFTGDRLRLNDSLVVEPRKVVAAWAPKTVNARPEGLERADGGWRLRGLDETFDAVVVAAGWGTPGLLPGLPLAPIRGQASFVASPARPAAVVDGDYLIPTTDGFLFGATHDRDRDDVQVTEADHRRNLAALARLAPELAEGLGIADLEGRTAVRAVTPDRLPLAGAVEDGLYVLSGLGSRGFTTAPLLAEHVAALIADAPSPLPADLQALVDPRRFSPER